MHTQKVAYVLSIIIPKSMTLNDPERRYFALFCGIRQGGGYTMPNWLKLDPYCLQRNEGKGIYFLQYMTHSDVIRDYC